MARVAGDEAVILPPLNRFLAAGWSRRAGSWADGGEPADLEQLEEVLVRLSQIVVDFPEVEELEINPCLSSKGSSPSPPRHLRTADCLRRFTWPRLLPEPVRVRRAAQGWREVLSAPSGRGRAAHFAFIRASPPRPSTTGSSVQQGVTDEQMIRFTQIDYDREIALVAA